jgi:hypothetical protein
MCLERRSSEGDYVPNGTERAWQRLTARHENDDRRRRVPNPPNRIEKCGRLKGCHRIHDSVEVIDHDNAGITFEFARTRHPRCGMAID